MPTPGPDMTIITKDSDSINDTNILNPVNHVGTSKFNTKSGYFTESTQITDTLIPINEMTRPKKAKILTNKSAFQLPQYQLRKVRMKPLINRWGQNSYNLIRTYVWRLSFRK